MFVLTLLEELVLDVVQALGQVLHNRLRVRLHVARLHNQQDVSSRLRLPPFWAGTHELLGLGDERARAGLELLVGRVDRLARLLLVPRD